MLENAENKPRNKLDKICEKIRRKMAAQKIRENGETTSIPIVRKAL